MLPGAAVANPISAISLGMALMFGTAGLPHILMRFFTVGNAKEARKSVFWATTFIGYFYILTFIIGFGAIVLVGPNAIYHVGGDIAKGLLGGGNMPAIHLAHAVGGDLMKGFIAAVAFATILAVVSGLTLSGASAVSHDLYASVFRHGRVDEAAEVRVSRITTVVLGIVAIVLGVVFEKINVAFMVGLAFAVAASANFPVLLLSMLWKGLTTRGAVIGGLRRPDQRGRADRSSAPASGSRCSASPRSGAWFPYTSPAIFTHAARVPLLLVLLDHRQVGGAPTRSGRRSTRNTCARRPASAPRRRPRTKTSAAKAKQTKGASSAAGRPSH